ncbi:MAG: hypothetical protein UMV23_01375 [Halanaerobium sp.]|nr:hypothetical protein [Halanaerobium sp.]
MRLALFRNRWMTVVLLSLLVLGILTFSASPASCEEEDLTLSNLINGYLTTQEKLWFSLGEDDYSCVDDFSIFYLVSDTNIRLEEIKYYDLLNPISLEGEKTADGIRYTHKDIGYKEVQAERVIFGCDQVYEDTMFGVYEAGDTKIERGVVGRNNRLEFHSEMARDGVAYKSELLEIALKEDDTYLLQYIIWEEGAEARCLFVRLTEEEKNFIIARGRDCNEVQYSSILEGNPSLEEMAEGYIILMTGKLRYGQFTCQQSTGE